MKFRHLGKISKNFGFFIPDHRQKLKTQAKKTVSGKKLNLSRQFFYCVRQIVTVVNDRILNKSSNLLVTLSIAIVPNETQINFL